MSFFKIALVAASFFTASLSFADGPAFDKVKWDELVTKTTKYGEPLQVDRGLEFHSLSRITPEDLTNTHLANYFSTMGYIDSNGVYSAYAISVVAENWVLNEQKEWEIDQWIYLVSLAGELKGINHFYLKESLTGLVLDSRSYPVEDITHPASLENWSKKQAEWMQ